jgi:hypothetical protein
VRKCGNIELITRQKGQEHLDMYVRGNGYVLVEESLALSDGDGAVVGAA